MTTHVETPHKGFTRQMGKATFRAQPIPSHPQVVHRRWTVFATQEAQVQTGGLVCNATQGLTSRFEAMAAVFRVLQEHLGTFPD